jgi:putative addiction module killer protein/probable addiction module antidote protein
VTYEVRYYLTDAGRDVFLDWIERMRDATAKVAIARRVNRLGAGNFGDHAFCRDGVWELRIDVGAGYRVYYAVAGRAIVLLLGGGDKRSQATDINRACDYWRSEKRRLQDFAMAELYRRDPVFALRLLNEVLADGDQQELLVMLRQMSLAFGGVRAIAGQADLNPTQLYRTLSAEGNPSLSTLTAVLKAMGLRIAVQPIKRKRKVRA